MSRLGVYDNWEKLVGAVIDRERLHQLALCDSFSSTSSSIATISRLSNVSSGSRLNIDYAAASNELDQLTDPRAPNSDNVSTQASIARGVAAVVFAAPLAYYRRRRLREYDLFVSNYFIDDFPVHQLDQLERYSLRELQVATDNFSNRNVLGRGGFGKVYKGRLADGSLVAIKRHKEEHTQGGELMYRTEVKMKFNMSAHPNLLQLRGFCLTQKERMLVFPYMANGSVASRLRARTESQTPLDWATRERIALGSAKGIAYLHEQCGQKIIHRDVKAANILLNEDFEAVVGDFGLTEFMDHEDAHVTTHFEPVIFSFGLAIFMDHEDTHVTTAIRGTIGHIAPEYLSTGKASEKTDVFAYGIMLLELISGQRAFDLTRLANDDEVMLLDWVKRLLREKKFDYLVDTDLRGNYIDEEVEQLIQVSLLCSQSSPEKRPKMSDVVQMLQGDDGLAERWQEYCGGSSYTYGGRGSNVSSSLLLNFDYAASSNAHELENFSLHELQVATDNFCNRNLLGRSRFGKVYKGRLADGSLVAAKRIEEEHTENGERQFRTEVKMKFNTTAHPNLLQLRGFCLAPAERILVYPYMPNGSVASCLRERTESQPLLSWSTREQIALGSAKGLAYLHDQWPQKIVHCDVQAANILLNEDFEAIVGDFGLSEFLDHEDAHLTAHFEPVICDFGLARLDHDITHISSTSGVCGTIGHVAPEYLSTRKVSEKTDVFAYGIMLLELISAQRAFDLASLANDEHLLLLDWVKRLLGEKKLDKLVDTDLRGNYNDEEVEQLIQVSLLCSQSSPEKRPKMSDVVQMLQGDDGLAERWQEYCDGSSYAFYHASTHGGHGSTINSLAIVSDEEIELSGPR